MLTQTLKKIKFKKLLTLLKHGIVLVRSCVSLEIVNI